MAFAASNAKPACACAQDRRLEAQHSGLSRARAAPRWLWSAMALWKCAASAGGSPPSARGRVATCQLQPPTRSRLPHGHGEEAQYTSCRASCGRFRAYQVALHRREACLLRHAASSRGVIAAASNVQASLGMCLRRGARRFEGGGARGLMQIPPPLARPLHAGGSSPPPQHGRLALGGQAPPHPSTASSHSGDGRRQTRKKIGKLRKKTGNPRKGVPSRHKPRNRVLKWDHAH